MMAAAAMMMMTMMAAATVAAAAAAAAAMTMMMMVIRPPFLLCHRHPHQQRDLEVREQRLRPPHRRRRQPLRQHRPLHPPVQPHLLHAGLPWCNRQPGLLSVSLSQPRLRCQLQRLCQCLPHPKKGYRCAL
jgi:hypothetical protein